MGLAHRAGILPEEILRHRIKRLDKAAIAYYIKIRQNLASTRRILFVPIILSVFVAWPWRRWLQG
jgi:hypothetical protein